MTFLMRCMIFIILFVPVLLKAAEPLASDQAFQLQAAVDSQHRERLTWTIAPRYFLYRDKIKITSPERDIPLHLPKGQLKHNSIRGNYQVYTGTLTLTVPESTTLLVSYQGCSSEGFCYPLITKKIIVSADNQPIKIEAVSDQNTLNTEESYAEILLNAHSLGWVVIGFLGLGLLLAFTPCILPMIPILSGIIVDHHTRRDMSHGKAFLLCLFYVLGMAFTYMWLGIAAAMLGSSLQVMMQQPWAIILFSALFVLLALSLFGVYELHLPARWQAQLLKWDRHLKHGTYPSSFLMGALSSLMVSPCVTAPLVGVLAYIADTKNILFGAIALFMLGIGMGLPLLIVGTAAKKLLPKSGPWMVSIQKLFGLMMVGMAIWFLSRILSTSVVMLLYAALCVGIAVTVWKLFFKWISIVILIYSVLLVSSVIFNNPRLMKPWEYVYAQSFHVDALSFVTVKTVNQLESQLTLAQTIKKPVLLDYYADWCVSCRVMQDTVFAKAAVQSVVQAYQLVQVDVTKNDDESRALLKKFHVIAPPTIIFIDASGKEHPDRIIGEVSARQFIKIMKEL